MKKVILLIMIIFLISVESAYACQVCGIQAIFLGIPFFSYWIWILVASFFIEFILCLYYRGQFFFSSKKCIKRLMIALALLFLGLIFAVPILFIPIIWFMSYFREWRKAKIIINGDNVNKKMKVIVEYPEPSENLESNFLIEATPEEQTAAKAYLVFLKILLFFIIGAVPLGFYMANTNSALVAELDRGIYNPYPRKEIKTLSERWPNSADELRKALDRDNYWAAIIIAEKGDLTQWDKLVKVVKRNKYDINKDFLLLFAMSRANGKKLEPIIMDIYDNYKPNNINLYLYLAYCLADCNTEQTKKAAIQILKTVNEINNTNFQAAVEVLMNVPLEQRYYKCEFNRFEDMFVPKNNHPNANQKIIDWWNNFNK